VGESSSVAAVVMGVREVSRVELVLVYDPTLIQAVELTSGSLLTLDGARVGVEQNLEPGRARAVFTRPTGVTGSGVIASLSFRALRPGTATIAVATLALTTGGGTQAPAAPAPARIVVVP
jgi:hypothetical protein